MSDLYIETRLQAIKDIASASCVDIKDADNIASFCDEIYSAIPNIDKVVDELEEMKTIKGSMKTVTCRKWDYGTVNRTIEIVKQGDIRKDVNK